ncbi:LRRC6 [Acanthosepion pharaonis]|uniref:LRRC6 n=1 Tax=Acanthosepion pharaonis TaxID=158019 RepID=A0A812ETD4_ACAPH|nr:LRRC6 [Sepia pharaonis]
MVRITEDLIRKRAEHNNCEISTLEEVSLHQQDIERIENLDKWCRELKILYLQSNLIPKIENVSRLKKLDYLNLALNNIERIENLEGCESLRKLDLTVNFIGELTSIKCLKDLYHFNELFLTGNPCTQFEGYRDYVIATLPNLKFLDGKEIEKSERILALQDLKSNEKKIIKHQEKYFKEREEQKAKANKSTNSNDKENGFPDSESTKSSEEQENKRATKEKTEEELEKEFWDEVVPFTPESRIEVHKHLEKLRTKDSDGDLPEKEKKIRRLFADDGRPFNINEAKVDFHLTDDTDANAFILDLACYRYLDTNLLEVDVQPLYVRVIIKGKIFQLGLNEEVNTDSSYAKRSQVTGNLLITMPKMKPILYKKKKPQQTTNEKEIHPNHKTGPQPLEVGDGTKSVDYCNIVNEKNKGQQKKLFGWQGKNKWSAEDGENSEDFIDDPTVPALI